MHTNVSEDVKGRCDLGDLGIDRRITLSVCGRATVGKELDSRPGSSLSSISDNSARRGRKENTTSRVIKK